MKWFHLVKMENQKYLKKFRLNANTKFEIMHIVFRKLKIFIFFFFLPLNFNHFSYAHMKGTFSSEQKAINRSLELGCEGIHKNQDKWLPCQNEKELHKYLRK